MTDKEKLLALMREFGVTIFELTGSGSPIHRCDGQTDNGVLIEKNNLNCQFSFDDSGEFTDVTMWADGYYW